MIGVLLGTQTSFLKIIMDIEIHTTSVNIKVLISTCDVYELFHS